MGGLEPTGDYMLELLRAGKPVVTANKQLLARRSTELFAAAAETGVQLRFEASVCAAIPVIKVLRESLVVTNVHRVLGIVNGTTNFILTRMETGAGYEEALAEAQRLGYAEADPTEDVSGADAAAKMAILASVAFGSRVELDDVAYEGIERIRPEHVEAADSLDSVIRLVGTATLVDGAVDVRVSPALVNRHHPLASVEGPFNAVMLHGDAIREIMLEGPGAGGLETASAVVADMVSVLGTTGTGFLQDDACWRSLPTLPRASSRRRSTSGSRSRTGPACSRTSPSGSPTKASRLPSCRSTCRTGARRSTWSRIPRRRGASPPRSTRSRLSPRCTPVPRRSASSPNEASEMAVAVTLGEGSTPLLSLPRLSARLGVELWVKWEGANPTGSFKDRGMAVAVSRALERGAPGIVCASTGNTAASAAAYGARAGLPAIVVTSRGAVARGKMIQARAAGVEAREIDGTFNDAHLEARRLAEAEGLVNVNSINPDRIEGQSTAAREVLEQLGGLPDVLALPYGGGGNTVSYAKGFSRQVRRDAAALPLGRGGAAAGHVRERDPDRRTRPPRGGRPRAGALRRADRLALGGRPRAGLALARAGRGHLLRARQRRRHRRRRGGRTAWRAGRLRRHRPRPERPRRGLSQMTLRVRAPATTANIGPGFDCAGAALDLWNELELEPGDGPVDRDHLGVRAFERLTPADGWSFTFSDNIPQARGLGSSASIVALGLVAAAIVGKLEPTADELLALGVELEGHGDNLAAALVGGVCLTWGTHIARIADTTPATPIALVPAHRVETAASRAALPDSVPHADAAFSGGTRRAARRGTREQLAGALRSRPGGQAPRALPRRQLPTPRRGSRPAARGRARRDPVRRRPDRHGLGAQRPGRVVRRGARIPLPR